MWAVIELWRPLGSIPIKEIKLNASSRDDIPTLRAIACPLRHGIFPCPISSVGSSALVCPAC